MQNFVLCELLIYFSKLRSFRAYYRTWRRSLSVIWQVVSKHDFYTDTTVRLGSTRSCKVASIASFKVSVEEAQPLQAP